MPSANDSRNISADRPQSALLVPFLALVIVAPLPLGGYRPLPWSFNAIAVALLLLAWALLSLRHGARAPVGLSRLAVPMMLGAGVALWMLVQALATLSPHWNAPVWGEIRNMLPTADITESVSANPEAGVVTLFRFLTHAAIFFLAAQLGRSPERAERIFTTLAYMGLGYSLYGLAMHLGGVNRILWWERWAYTDSVTSTFVNRNHFATFAGLTLLCAMGLLGRSLLRRGNPRDARELLLSFSELLERHWALLLTTCITFSALALTHSRAGLAASLGGIATLIFLLPGRKQVEWHSARPMIGVVTAGFLVLLVMMGGGTISRLGDLTLQAEQRDELIRLGLRAIGDAPWLGHGGGSFGDVIRIYRDQSLSSGVQWDHAHNSYLEFALEFGIPALLALLLLFAWLAGRCLIGLARRRRDRVYPAVGIAATVLVGLHAVVDFSIQLPGVAIPYVALLGVAYAQSWPSGRRMRGRAGRPGPEHDASQKNNA